MPQIPLYQQKVAPTTQVATAPSDGGSAAAPFNALAKVGGEVAKIGFNLQERMNKEEGEAQTAGYMAERKVRANALDATLATMTDPDEIEEFYTQWKEDESTTLNESRLNKESRRKIGNNYEDFNARMDMGVAGYHRKAKINNMDRSWIDVQQLGLSNQTDDTILNDNGQVMSPAEVYEYATMKRVDLGTVKYEDAVGDISDFGQNLDFRRITTSADNNPDEAQAIFDEANLTGEKLVQAADVIRDSRERQENLIHSEQTRATNDVNKEVQGKTLSRQQLDLYSKETTTVMGKEVPLLTPSVVSANRQYLNSQEDFDEAFSEDTMVEIRSYIDNVTNEGRSDFGQKETDKMYRSIGNLGLNGASKATMESLLNTANIATGDYADGRGWNSASVAMINDITDAYTTLYTEGDYRLKDVGPVTSIINKVDSFIKEVETHKGNPTPKALKEWRELNMPELDADMALNKYSNNYRVGERKQTEDGPRVYKGGGVFEVEIN
jgi:hypothetical protein